MNYNSATPFRNIEKLVSINKPSMIVGSSMGGLFALKIGTFYNIPLILLNPALVKINSTLDTPNNYGEFRPKIWALVGRSDELIPAQENKLVLEDFGASVTIWDHGHRTPNDVFLQYIESIKSELIENF
jgi:dienelactone hydrolase